MNEWYQDNKDWIIVLAITLTVILVAVMIAMSRM